MNGNELTTTEAIQTIARSPARVEVRRPTRELGIHRPGARAGALKLSTGPGLESINDAAARRLKELAVGLKDFAAPAHNAAAEAKG